MAINIKGTKPASPQPDPSKADIENIGGSETAASAAPTEASQAASDSQEGEDQGTDQKAPSQPQPEAPGIQTGASFLMTGNQQKSQIDQVKAVQEMRAKLRGGAREFWLNPGEFAKLYFLDGKLLSDNVFDTPMVNLHMLQIGGQWAKFICNTHTEGECVVCASNADGSRVDTLQLFTVINTMPYVIQGGPNKGKTLPARLQLFAASTKTRERLIKRAQNHGNALAGSLYQFSRSDKQSARTGDDIEFISEYPIPAVIGKYPKLSTRYNEQTKKWEDAPTVVYDYAKCYPVLTNAEIASLRPDLASMAGFTNYTPAQAQPNTGFGSDPTSEIEDSIPF